MGKSEAERAGEDGNSDIESGGDNLTILTIILTICLVISLEKQFLYYSALTGVLFHILNEYDIELSSEEVKELQIKAGTRLIKEFFHMK